MAYARKVRPTPIASIHYVIHSGDFQDLEGLLTNRRKHRPITQQAKKGHAYGTNRHTFRAVLLVEEFRKDNDEKCSRSKLKPSQQ